MAPTKFVPLSLHKSGKWHLRDTNRLKPARKPWVVKSLTISKCMALVVIHMKRRPSYTLGVKMCANNQPTCLFAFYKPPQNNGAATAWRPGRPHSLRSPAYPADSDRHARHSDASYPSHAPRLKGFRQHLVGNYPISGVLLNLETWVISRKNSAPPYRGVREITATHIDCYPVWSKYKQVYILFGNVILFRY